MQPYRVSGEFQMGGEMHPFTLETLADTTEEAREWTFSVLGSKHRVRRTQVDIDQVSQPDPDEVEDPTVRYKLDKQEA
ncbi:50S ribosomal protein L18a [Thermoplasmatales archaeon SW_10_69_26]|jgi:large subunit ribosomal protein LX|nr:MAG: 50S ribosomal protein L18a [Thermoplasmatales archaeon SW_10_69_26]